MPITISSVNIDERRNLDFRAGDTVRVTQKITERIMEKDKVKEKKRLQAFEGLVLARKHGFQQGATFTVRSVVDGVGVEKIYPIYSPNIISVKIVSSSKKVRRSKLYYLRNVSKKKSRQKIGVAA